MILKFSILLFYQSFAVDPSLSTDYTDNPENYYRNPCPIDRSGQSNACNALDEYVWKKDENYKWELKETYTDYPGITGYAILLHSQQWLNESIYTIQLDGTTVWKHWVNLWVPNDVNIDKDLLDSALILIDGGGNRSTPPSIDDSMITYGRFYTSTTGGIFVVVKQIPNERLVFKNDWRDTRTEDGIIALTWRHFLDFPDQPEWLLRFPMVKASLRAMDAASEFVQTIGFPELKRWGVTGASKRGWTTWLVGAVDTERVVMMAPIVLDCLPISKTFHQMYENTGNWTFPITDYWFEQIMGRMDDQNIHAMELLIDGYEYRERLRMPKVIISSTGDEFFMPDDSYNFFDDLLGPTYFRMMPNTDHSTLLGGLSNPHFFFSLRSTFLSVLKDYPMPTLKWERFDDPIGKTGSIIIETDQAPKNIYGWVGDSRSNFRRDFRVAGVRNNEYGAYLKPDYPILPPGYPDVAPEGFNASAFTRVKGEDLVEMEKFESDADSWYNYLAQNEMEDQKKKFVLNHKQFDPSWVVPKLKPEDIKTYQVQGNLFRKVMANKIGKNKYKLEFDESPTAFRAFFFEVSFQGPDHLNGFEFTSEVQIIPAKRPFSPCYGIDCQGALI